jgi:uncharacterized SAM-binding protein YcdF (DUF218 family)
MFFVLTKVFQALVLPPSGLLLLMLAGFLIVKKNRRAGGVLIASGAVLLYMMSIHLVSDALVRPLEKSHPPLMQAPVDARAIVVLSGGVKDLSWIGLEPEPSETSLVRTVTGVLFYRARRIPFIVVGGSGDPSKPDIREADAMARVASGLGVPRKDIIIENKAKNTLESAVAVKTMFTGKRIILVTSAQHMKRAAGMFVKQGFDVIPAPTEYHGERRGVSLSSFIPNAGNLNVSSRALSEYMSLAWYSMRGDL